MNLKGCGTKRRYPVPVLACVGRPTKAKKIPGDHYLVSTTFFFLLTTFYFPVFNYLSSHFNQVKFSEVK